MDILAILSRIKGLFWLKVMYIVSDVPGVPFPPRLVGSIVWL